MAVTIVTKFYEEQDEDIPGDSEAGEWHSLAKIVFTSPNMDSPNTVGTRSHILPGGGVDLGLWYEDVSYMYRIADCQQITHESYTNCSGTLVSGTCISGSGYSCFCQANSVNFQLTAGECYDCRLTAFDDATHTTTLNEILLGGYCRVSAFAFNYEGSDFKNPDAVNVVHAPVYNNVLQGNVGGSYYGDFDMVYRAAGGGKTGDFLIFKPMLYCLDSSISYGVHDFVIVLMYSYT